jgi:beta-galactosidase
VSDCFIEPGLHGADINLDILNDSQQSAKVQIDYSIKSVQDGTILYSNETRQPFEVTVAATNQLKLTTPALNPKLWSPQTPNLYDLEVRLKSENKVIDSYKVRFGFRTFAVDGNRFLLNGQPFWLRGANPFPNTLMPNDKELARRFMTIARQGNVSVTRSHIVPFTSTWLDAADEVGVGVSFEGTWPWLMLEGEPPGDDLVQAWKSEFISLIKEYRNHPSIILWTVNNEMKFEQMDQNNPERLKKKWAILNDAIKAMREADPARPVVADSSYVRKETQHGYQTLVKPEGLDDGDVDDLHRYYGWYNESFFHFYDGQYNQLITPDRPFISQEMSTGYPNNDDGHPARFYLFKHYTPQALVGDYAYENADPAIFLKRQAFMTKGLAETVRRTSHEEAAGILYFSYFTWFQTPWSATDIKPWPTYYALKAALQPVLVSAELYGRHFYSGTAFHERVCIVNDSEDHQPIAGSHLIWEFQNNGQVLSQGQVEVPSVNFYENHWLDVEFKTPQHMSAPRVDGQLALKLESNGKILSENNYDVVIATPEWARGELNDKTNILLWNPGKTPIDSLSDVLMTAVDSIETVDPKNVLIVGSLDNVILTSLEIDQLKNFVSQGGRILMLHPGKQLTDLFSDQVKSYKAKEGEIVTMHVPESPVFSGIEPLDIAWFDRGDRRLPLACTGVYQTVAGRHDTIILADQCDIHAYLKNTSEITRYNGTPLVEMQIGKGRLLASELNLEAGKNDPVACRLLINMIGYLEK